MMPSTPDWEKEVESKYEREQEEIRHTSRISVFFSVLVLIGASIVFGVVQFVRWGLMGESLLPAKTDVYWFAGMVIWLVILPPVFERWEEARKLSIRRLIRLEMKIDALLERHDR
jgi:hypothetical protein